MTMALYDASVASYLQTLGGVAKVLARGEEYAASGKLDLEQLLGFRLREDMLPFNFQIISVWHHPPGALQGIRAGLFVPPPSLEEVDYAKLRDLVAEAIGGLKSGTRWTRLMTEHAVEEFDAAIKAAGKR